MLITDFQITEQGDTKEASADVDGFRLWYRVPKTYPVSRAGDPFLAAALLPAMLKGEELEVDPSLSVSPKLLRNISLLQEIHHSWNPVLKIIPVKARTSPAEQLNKGAFSFFSGGVDSMYTFLKHQREISHVVFIHGFDFYLDNGAYRTAVTRNSSFVDGFGKTLIPVETNYYVFGHHYNLSRVLTQGSTLASVALLLGFPRVYVPASRHYTYLAPLGSHPLTDPLYSNECVEIIHDGAETRRVDKVIKVAECEPTLANLTVCWDDMNTNCGKCIKCLRTLIPLKLLGATAAPFPPFSPLKAIRRISWKDEPNYLKENINLALQTGNTELHDALLACVRRYERIQLIKEIDRVLLGGVIKRAYRRIMKHPPGVPLIGITPPRD